ncbi:MAG: hypothetical protein IKP35_04820 [Alphaproteobacteria bacterium]|nr:hypothetical protein [Alphaproteobacteria bacterium]
MTATVKQIRRGTAAENDAFTGAIGEVTMDTTNKTLRVHDGETLGGTILAKKSQTTDPNLSNITSTAKTTIFKSTLPSLTNSISNIFDSQVTSTSKTYTAPSQGFCYASCAKSNGAMEFYRNNMIVGYGGSSSADDFGYFAVMIPCDAGDIIKYKTTSGTGIIWASYFYRTN